MPKGIYERKPRQSSYPLRERLHCGKCDYVWHYTGVASSTHCPVCNNLIDARDKTNYAKQYAELHPERKNNMREWWLQNSKEHAQKTYMDLRRKVFAIVSKSTHPQCENCGCDDVRLLEINHKNGKGNKEWQSGRNSMAIYRDIVMLRRTVVDLNLFCRVCNAKHYLELKYGKLPIEVKWNGI